MGNRNGPEKPSFRGFSMRFDPLAGFGFRFDESGLGCGAESMGANIKVPVGIRNDFGHSDPSIRRSR